MVKEFLVKPNRSVYLVQGKISLPNYPQYFVLKVYNSNIMPTEVEIHLELSKSDNSILQVYDHWPENNYYYMSIEYCENGDLHSYLEIVKGQPIGLQLVLFTASQLAFTLSSMHKLLICHRDIKPLNIYMKAERTVFKLADFGEAKKVHTNALGYNTMTGTPYYMSPEQKGNFFSGLNEQVNPYRDDIWALGRTFLEISFARLCPETLKMDVPTLHVFIDRGFERIGYSYEFRDLIKRMMTQIENFNITADVVLFEINSLYNKLFILGNNYLSNSMNLNSSGSNFSYDVPDLNGFTSVAGNNLKVPPFHVSKGPDLPGKDPSFVSIIPSPLNSRIASEPPAFNPYQQTIPPPILQGKNDGNNFYNHPQVPNNDLNQMPAYPPGPSKFSILPSNDKPPDLNSSYLPASMPQNALPDNIGLQKVFSPKIAKVPQFPDVSNLHKVADYPYQINVPKQSDLSNFPPALQNLHLSKVVGIHDMNNQSNLPPNVPPLVQNILNVPNVPKAPGTPNMQVPNNLPPNVPNIPKVPSTPNMQVPNNLPLNVPPVFQNMQNVGNIHKPPDFPNTQNALNLIPSVPPENVPKIPNSSGILNVSSFSKLPNSEATGLKHSSGTFSVPDLSGSSKALIMPKLPHDLNPHIFPRESCSPESQNYSKNFSKVPDLPQKKTGNYFNDGGSSGIRIRKSHPRTSKSTNARKAI
jgi:serine/threonine protein kinase